MFLIERINLLIYGTNMKKFTLLLILLFCVELVSAKSDIQLSSPLFSLFNKFEVSSESFTYNSESFFISGDSLLRVANQNYFNDRFGFYESISICTSTFWTMYSFGIKIALGPSIKILNAEYVDINMCLGPDIQITGKGIILGSEIDIQAKFTPNRRCSPIIGTIINFDFFSTFKTQKKYLIRRTSEYVYYYSTNIDENIQKYIHFYVQPYIAFCVNLY